MKVNVNSSVSGPCSGPTRQYKAVQGSTREYKMLQKMERQTKREGKHMFFALLCSLHLWWEEYHVARLCRHTYTLGHNELARPEVVDITGE